MAMPYPEGEVFFKRSALRIPLGKGKHAWSFNPDDAKEFASHILVEYIYNRPCNHRYSRAYPVYSEASGKKYFHPSSFNVMFASSLDKLKQTSPSSPTGLNLTSTVEIDTLDSGTEYRDNVNGGPDKVCIMPVPVSGKDDRYLFIDLLAPVRAIYLPLAHKVDILDPDLCTYIMIDFRFRKGVEMWFEGGYGGVSGSDFRPVGDVFPMEYKYELNRVYNGRTVEEMMKRDGEGKEYEPPTHPMHKPQPFSYKEGLGLQPGRALQVDMLEAYNLLVLPRQMRSPDKGLYKPKNPNDSIVRNRSQDFTTPFNWGHLRVQRSLQILDYTSVISDHFGVDVVWQPYEFKEESKSLVVTLFTLGSECGLNLIPIIGPLASAGFGVFMEAVYDPEEFKKNNILDLGPDALESGLDAAKKIAKNLPSGRKGKVLKLVASA